MANLTFDEICNVYRLDPVSGVTTVVADDFVRPNGIGFSPDESRLYVVDSGVATLRVYDVVGGAKLGNNVKVQNNVSIYTGVEIEDDVFLGPSCVLTNVTNPRSQVNRHSLYERTLIQRGATVGANATIVCGTTLGRYAFVAAGAVVTKDVPDYALVAGNPARPVGWMSRHGHRLKPGPAGVMLCPESGYRYREVQPGVVRCLDLDEGSPIPPELSRGAKSYDEFKQA